jgi:hypothetical protein
MTQQPNSPLVAGVVAGAAAAGRNDEDQATDDGQPVGEADVRADAERTGAGDDDTNVLGGSVDAAPSGAEGASTDDGVPVGEADAEADRRRSGADDNA